MCFHWFWGITCRCRFVSIKADRCSIPGGFVCHFTTLPSHPLWWHLNAKQPLLGPTFAFHQREASINFRFRCNFSYAFPTWRRSNLPLLASLLAIMHPGYDYNRIVISCQLSIHSNWYFGTISSRWKLKCLVNNLMSESASEDGVGLNVSHRRDLTKPPCYQHGN